MKKVYVGLSGGVDSSVSALLLKEQGFDVTGVYMKNWSQDLPGFACPWFEDYQDAKRIAVQLGIKFEMFDFEKDYKQLVVDYMIDEYKRGRTPNPDIMCNQEIKFRLFYQAALDKGADFIATGHYARVGAGKLLTAADASKDQTYFLYRMPKAALEKTIFPLGGLTKKEVRHLAAANKLITADKKESMGICFVGKVGIKDFLQNYVKTEPGGIYDQNGKKVGEHDGAIFYTIGQRHGLSVGGAQPYYVTGKNMAKNEVYVTSKLDDQKLWSKNLYLNEVHLLTPETRITGRQLAIRTRHLAPLIKCQITFGDATCSVPTLHAELSEELRAVAPGQSAVIYDGETVIGGGIIA